jgi:hypothetical protein
MTIPEHLILLTNSAFPRLVGLMDGSDSMAVRSQRVRKHRMYVFQVNRSDWERNIASLIPLVVVSINGGWLSNAVQGIFSPRSDIQATICKCDWHCM